MLKTTLRYYCSSLPPVAQRNDSALIDTLVKNIASAQVTTDDEFLYRHVSFFPAMRRCPTQLSARQQHLFTAIAAFALRNMVPHLDEKQPTDCSAVMKTLYSFIPAL